MVQEDVVPLLPQLVRLADRPWQAALSRMLDPRQGSAAPPLAPWELLVSLHTIETTAPSEGVGMPLRPIPPFLLC